MGINRNTEGVTFDRGLLKYICGMHSAKMHKNCGMHSAFTYFLNLTILFRLKTFRKKSRSRCFNAFIWCGYELFIAVAPHLSTPRSTPEPEHKSAAHAFRYSAVCLPRAGG